MTFNPSAKIGDLVLELPAAMRVFEGLNIDYCCGGHRSLAEACTLAGKNPAEVILALEALQATAPAPTDPKVWAEAPLAALAEHIETTHHVFTREELARVAPLMEKVVRVHGANHPELIRLEQCFQAMRADLLPHLEKEEQVLFPFIRGMASPSGGAAGCFGAVANPVRAMQAEHEAVGDILREIRILTRDFTAPEDACGSFRSLYLGLQALEEDLHLHIYLESHLLFPRAVALEEAAAGLLG
jgi:regulator of cell morphogenesis and NO signaling